MTAVRPSLSFESLLKLRLVVARHGEMDGFRWWNTDGVLGRKGSLLISRGFPKTCHFARARLVFAVARARSAERFPTVPGCVTLWDLPPSIEDAFEAQWTDWIEDGGSWDEFFNGLQEQNGDLLTALRVRHLLSSDHDHPISQMRRSAEGRAVPISGLRHLDDSTVTLLAAGFSCGEATKLAVPYARVEGWGE